MSGQLNLSPHQLQEPRLCDLAPEKRMVSEAVSPWVEATRVGVRLSASVRSVLESFMAGE
jgi:hypothetical protein